MTEPSFAVPLSLSRYRFSANGCQPTGRFALTIDKQLSSIGKIDFCLAIQGATSKCQRTVLYGYPWDHALNDPRLPTATTWRSGLEAADEGSEITSTPLRNGPVHPIEPVVCEHKPLHGELDVCHRLLRRNI